MTKENIINSTRDNDRFGLLIVISLFTGWIFDHFFIYDQSPGISITLFTILVFVSFRVYMNNKLNFKNSDALIVSGFTILIALHFSIFNQNQLFFINLLLLIIMIPFSLMLLARSNQYKWYQINIIEDIVVLITRMMMNFFYSFPRFAQLFQNKSLDKEQSTVIRKVIIGLAIASPIIVIVMALLVSADKQFLQLFDDVVKIFEEWFADINIQKFIFHIIVIVMVFFLTLSYFWTLQKRNGLETLGSNLKLNFDSIIVTTVLICLNIVYLLFIYTQSDYLLKGDAALIGKGIDYSGEARQSFFELVLVAIINISIILSVLHFLKKEKKLSFMIAKISLIFLILETFIILYSSHFTLSLYERVLGYTFLRVLSHSFIIYIAILLVLTIYKIIRSDFNYLQWTAYLGLVWYLIFNYMNVDSMIARENIIRFKNGKAFDTEHILKLSSDAYPEIIKFVKNINEDEKQRLSRNYSLIKRKLKTRKQIIEQTYDSTESWRAYNYSKKELLNLLNENKSLISN